MTLLLWVGVFVVSLIALVKGADWVLDGAKKIGLALGMSPFVVGVLILGFGTSAPELVSSVAGVLQGATEIPVANVVGSNIANILLIIGFSAVIARGAYAATKNLVDLEIPLLILSTFFFFGIVYDGTVTRIEGLFLLAGFLIYLLYNFFGNKSDASDASVSPEEKRVTPLDIVLLIFGFALLILGAKYLVEAVLAISSGIGISVGIITLLAVAIGTSLPELIVSAKAALQGNAEVSLGNIFGSNIFNMLLVVGVPSLVTPLTVDATTAAIAIPAMLGVTVFFAISCLSNRIYVWEGAFYLLLYALFVVKIFGIA